MSKPMLIVGHGLAGCVLAMTCIRRAIPFSMVGCALPGEASLASSGLIAPITGRRYVKAWRIDEFIPAALDFYRWTEAIFGDNYFYPIEIVRYLAHAEGQKAWAKRLEDPEYAAYISGKRYPALDGGDRPYGIITGGYRLDTQGWMMAARNYLSSHGCLQELSTPHFPDEPFDGIKIFCTGAVDPHLPINLIPNKGESLVVRMNEWPLDRIVKEDVFIIPLQEASTYWIGSYYQPWPDHVHTTTEGQVSLLSPVKEVHKGDITVLDHKAGVRPTVNDRRPLIGPRPGHEGHYFFNGMGTKGTSLAPFWAEELLDNIQTGKSLSDEVTPSRYIPPYVSGKGIKNKNDG